MRQYSVAKMCATREDTVGISSTVVAIHSISSEDESLLTFEL